MCLGCLHFGIDKHVFLLCLLIIANQRADVLRVPSAERECGDRGSAQEEQREDALGMHDDGDVDVVATRIVYGTLSSRFKKGLLECINL